MYEKRFGCQRRPFPTTPDPAYYYPATGHERALTRLLRACTDDVGLMLLLGQPGTGKTLVAHCLLERLQAHCSHALLTNSHVEERKDLLQALLYDLSQPYEGHSEQELRLRLTDHLLSQYRAGKPTLLIIDEAHHLTVDLLEELRLLSNLEAGGRKAVQVLLLAQLPLLLTLQRPEMAALSQRLAVRTRLDPFGAEEAIDYVLHHLRSAGAVPEQVVSEEALDLIARGSGGIPRVLNQIAQQALLVADAQELDQIDAEAALEALSALGLELADEAEEDEEPPLPLKHPVAPENSLPHIPAYRLYEPKIRPAS